jgi:hypothetical protein
VTTDVLVPVVIAVITSLLASQGFWAYLQRKDTKKSATLRLLLGLAHDRIIFVGMSYVDRGWISKDEYEDFFNYLYQPYADFGGNGLAEKIMQEVIKLPIRGKPTAEFHIIKEKREHEHTPSD